MKPTAIVSVTLVLDEGDGVQFFADICTMLERLARRAQVPCEVLTDGTATRVFGLGLELPREIMREVGLHRAQLVPASSSTGRVVTAKVTVSVATVPSAAGLPLKTYRYPANQVVFHETGEVVPLDVVLSGVR